MACWIWSGTPPTMPSLPKNVWPEIESGNTIHGLHVRVLGWKWSSCSFFKQCLCVSRFILFTFRFAPCQLCK